MARDNECGGDTPNEVSLHHDWDRNDSVTMTILEGLAAVTDTPLTDLDPPLYDVVDPDALDTLFRTRSDDMLRDGSGQLTFPAYDCSVTLCWDGTITIDPPDES